MLADLDQLPLAPVLRAAALLPGKSLRSLDVLHLATAQQLPSLSVLLTYDRRLAQHATAAGLRTAAPAPPDQEPPIPHSREAHDADRQPPDEES